MNTELALLRSILAYPDDDTPRLIYADWLVDNGDNEKAEFIRKQLDNPDVPCRWPTPFIEKSSVNTFAWSSWPYWSRGFISSITCTWEDWEKHWSELIWWEKAEMQCPECKGGRIRITEKYGFGPCPCKTGRIPITLTHYHQPIVEVTLTTWPNWEAVLGRADRVQIDKEYKRQLSKLFPPIRKWNLPQP